jgi:serine/threonine protein kinase
MADFLQPGTMLREQYHVMRPLGQGGMGSVYLVEHTSLGKYYALKQMTLHNTPKLEQAFLREAKLLAHLEHPALPSVIDYFSTVEGLFLVMAYVEGPDLVELLHQNGRAFGWERVSPWAAQLLDVLDYLHSRAEPIVHRDIKPNNIKILPNGQLKLLDFGLAKSSWQELSQAAGGSSILGYTPGYAPPEQLAGKSTPLSDLYAVGATLYVLLTGRVPADAISRSSDVAVQEPDPLLPLDTLAKDLPPVVGRTIMQSLALRASDRPASAKAFAQQLQRWQAAVAHPAPAVVEKRKPEPVAHPVQETKPPEPAETPAARTTGDAVETMIDRSPVKPALPETKPPEPAEILTGQPNRDGRQIWLTETMIDRSPVKPAVAVKTTPEQPAETKHPVRRLPLLWVLGGVLVVALLGWFCWRVIQGSATLAGVGRTQKREKDGMVQVYVPAGCFEMGSTDGGG